VSSRTVTVLLLCALGVCVLGLEVLGHVRRTVPTLGGLAGRLSRWRPARVALFAVWAWCGWHFFAR
jgi:uncharacterized protein DUF6186